MIGHLLLHLLFTKRAALTYHLISSNVFCINPISMNAEYITPVLVSLQWLLIKLRINFKILLLAYKVLRGLTPSYLEELVTPAQ